MPAFDWSSAAGCFWIEVPFLVASSVDMGNQHKGMSP